MVRTFLTKWRRRRNDRRDLQRLSQHEFRLLARDIGISENILESVLAGDDRSMQLEKMLAAVGLDRENLRQRHPDVLVDMTAACMQCINVRACRRAHARSEASMCYREFCPNASTIESLVI